MAAEEKNGEKRGKGKGKIVLKNGEKVSKLHLYGL